MECNHPFTMSQTTCTGCDTVFENAVAYSAHRSSNKGKMCQAIDLRRLTTTRDYYHQRQHQYQLQHQHSIHPLPQQPSQICQPSAESPSTEESAAVVAEDPLVAAASSSSSSEEEEQQAELFLPADEEAVFPANDGGVSSPVHSLAQELTEQDPPLGQPWTEPMHEQHTLHNVNHCEQNIGMFHYIADNTSGKQVVDKLMDAMRIAQDEKTWSLDHGAWQGATKREAFMKSIKKTRLDLPQFEEVHKTSWSGEDIILYRFGFLRTRCRNQTCSLLSCL